MSSPDSASTVRHALNSDGEVTERSLAKTLSELARELRADDDMPTLLNHVVAATVDEVVGADHGGISLIDGKTIRAVAATSPFVESLDREQERLGQGPCLRALREEITVRCDDMATDERWPSFASAAIDAGVQSMLSVQLFVEGDNLGALNLYAGRPTAFSRHDESSAIALAAHAAVALKGRKVELNLQDALSSRDIIGQGKGILMERYRIDGEEAFRLLVLASQKTHVKLREVAYLLAATGELRVD